MGHPRRIFIPGVSVHVIHRGNNYSNIVGEDEDRMVLIRAFATAAARGDVAVHGYVVMDTHLHALVTPPVEGAVSALMKHFGELYVRYYNRKYERIGTLWAGRFRYINVENERRWWTCLRYIERNPVAAGIVTAPETYAWSSYRAHAIGEPFGWLTPHPLYLALGGTAEERQAAYRGIWTLPDPPPEPT